MRINKISKILLGFVIFPFLGNAQSDLPNSICFHFIDQFGYSVKPRVKIIDNEGNEFRLSQNGCFDYSSQTAFIMMVEDTKYYDYKKTYRMPIPKTDTIFLNNMITSIDYFIASENPVLTDDVIKELQNFNKYHFTSLTLEIYTDKYETSEFQSTIKQIFDLFLNNSLCKNFHTSTNFSVSVKNKNPDFFVDFVDRDKNVLYFLTGECYKINDNGTASHCSEEVLKESKKNIPPVK